MSYTTNNTKLRRVYCKIYGTNNIFWAYKNDDDDIEPNTIYKVTGDYIMTHQIQKGAVFHRWCTSFDL